MTPEAQGLWTRVLVRALVVVAAGVMALGFLGPEAALLVGFLTVLTYVLLWLRTRYAGSLLAGGRRNLGDQDRSKEPPRPGGPLDDT
ncbi:hypothetical protein [Nocardiopsis alkaliphila]|uniref:hypothetical protein n=1 Tax=Nocardiopsis alkaliphila TaxID=225762 RepID=UPI000476A99E|nr:hypothetical protein [Nocardiopsis alkaliphila]